MSIKWPGLKNILRRFWYGEARPPKTRRLGETGTPTTTEYYEGMDKDYRWFRQDELVRKCVLTNAYFACFAAGFDTVLEAGGDVENPDPTLKKYGYVKEQIDEINKRVNMDLTLFVTQIKRSVYGKAGWEIVLDDEEYPAWLLSLQSDKFKPKLNDAWELEKYTSTQSGAPSGGYQPEEILYFTNLQLEADREGLSDIEPIRDVCQARHELLGENFAEIVRTLWAPYTILTADTSMMTETEEDAFLQDLAEKARAGKSLAINEAVEAQIVSININFTGLLAMMDKFEEAIYREFGVPRFLVGKPIENRATAFAELESYVQGPIAYIQRYLKRELEAQWYDRWTRKILGVGEDEDLPVRVTHQWRRIRTSDIYEMAKAVALLWTRGEGVIRGRLEKAWDLMGWDPAELEEESEE